MNRAKRILKWVGLGLAGLFVVVTVVGYLLPSKVVVERRTTISAAPETIYPLIANLKEGWPQWSPWAEASETGYQYSGPAEGVGASQTFEDNGEGHLTITRADPKEGIEYDLVLMGDSFKLKGSMLCSPKGDQTELVWNDEIDYGGNPYFRYFGLIIDGPLGDQLAEGLAKIKAQAEKRQAAGLTAQKPD